MRVFFNSLEIVWFSVCENLRVWYITHEGVFVPVGMFE